jgi:hypothetical protein
MTETLLVTALAEGTGKTAVTIGLALQARERGDTVGYMKPKGTRLRSNVGKTLDEDPMLARELLDLDDEMHEMEPIVYSTTFIEQALRGKEDSDELAKQVRDQFDGLAADRDRMLVEGGGRYTTGGIVDLTDPEIAELLDAEVIVVAEYEEPGDVDELLAAADAIGETLDGVLFNAVTDTAFQSLETDVIPFLEGRGIEVHGAIPRVQELAGVTVQGLADELGATILNDGATGAYVERFSVGAMGADTALRHFRRTRDAAVITGGDRSDIHTAALEAPGVKCLILTGGQRPPGAIVGKAEEKGIPVLVVQTDTLTTIDRADNVVSGGRTNDEQSVERMRELLVEHVDLDGLLGSNADDEE